MPADATARVPCLVVAGIASGVGKTTVTVGVARALAARGLRVALFKCGPDYLDPTYHARATGQPSQNLDGWMMGKDAVLATFARASRGADIAVVEGMMGLFDGASPTHDHGSTAEIAKWLDAPVVVVADASAMARTLAAVAHGLASFDPELRVAGVVANRVGGPGHTDLLRAALRSPPLLGGVGEHADLAFPERHLGLFTADERVAPDAVLARWGAIAEACLSIDALLDLARSAGPLPSPEPCAVADAPFAERCRIAVARDEALHFYYEDNLRRLEELGATLVAFSPLRDTAVPDADGLILGGGYPELHARALAANASMRASILAFARNGAPVYAECGGLMLLAQAIRTRDGEAHPMVGLVAGEAVVRDTLQAIGYVDVATRRDTVVGPAGTRFRGHQFRHSELVGGAEGAAYSVTGRRGDASASEGYGDGNVLASYVHAHWASNPSVPRAFVAACVEHRAGRRA
jgi:cobyrinic acid a,c-diamide synthase